MNWAAHSPSVAIVRRDALQAAIVLLVSTAAATPLESAATKPLYSEPVSGRPVTSYTVILPTTSGTHDFRVPSDCGLIRQQHGEGGADRSRIVTRRLWLKAASDCRYFDLLNQYPPQALIDHLGNIEFRSLDLDTLPRGIRCSGSPLEFCSPGNGSEARGRPLFLPGPGASPAASRPPAIPCRLVNGQLLAEIRDEQGRLRCIPSGQARLRLAGVDFADVNGDRIRDAILRLVLISPGEGRRTLHLPLSRLEAGGPLQVPGTATVRDD